MSEVVLRMEIKNRCIDCQVRLSCKRYIKALQTMDGIEEMKPKIGSNECLIVSVLPETHGDLIDRDELFGDDKWADYIDGDDIRHTPAIVPATERIET